MGIAIDFILNQFKLWMSPVREMRSGQDFWSDYMKVFKW